MSVTLDQFRKRTIRSSLFPKSSLSAALNRMGFVQADPIRSPARAQDLILRQRVKNYQAGDLEAKYPQLPIEELFLFAYGFGSQGLWKAIYPKINDELSESEKVVLAVVEDQNGMHPRNLERVIGGGSAKNCWGGFSRAAKLALESLHDRGLLRIQKREKGTRVYEVAPACEAGLSGRERFKEIVKSTMCSMGPTSLQFLLSETRHFAYLEKSRSGRLDAIEELINSGQVRVDRVESVEYLSLAEVNPSRVPLDQIRILAPFDPIVRDRQRFKQLWGWEYRFEAYTPAARRKLGYYAMPVLWRDSIIGWANAAVEDGKLRVQFGYACKRPDEKGFLESAQREVMEMARFLGLEHQAFAIEL